MVYTEADYAELCWHDCHIWGMQFRSGNSGRSDWTSELALDLDFICEWRCGNGCCQFLVAPALLAFHGVAEAKIAIEWGSLNLMHEVSIAEIDREPAQSKGLDPVKPNYRWTIKLNWPESGEISLLAHGFTKTLQAGPILIDEQRFSFDARQKLLGR